MAFGLRIGVPLLVSHNTMDASLCVQVLAWAMLATGAVTFATTMLIKAPYGRYSASKGWGVLLPARLAWFVMSHRTYGFP